MHRKIYLVILAGLQILSVKSADYTIVEKDEYGAGAYYSGAIINNKILSHGKSNEMDEFEHSSTPRLNKTNQIAFQCKPESSQIINKGNFVVAHCHNHLQLMHMSPEGTMKVAQKVTFDNHIRGMSLHNNQLFLIDDKSRLSIFNLHPTQTLVLATQSYLPALSESDSFELKHRNTKLFVLGQGSNRVEAFDISSADQIKKLSSYKADRVFSTFELINNYLYLMSEHGLTVVNVSNARQPVLIEQTENIFYGKLKDIEYNGKHFVTITSTGRLYFIDISEPASPKFNLSRLSLLADHYKLKLSNNSLVAFLGKKGIKVINLEIPGEASVVSQYQESMAPGKISLDGVTALITDKDSVIHVIDINQDLTVKEKGKVKLSGHSRTGCLANDTIKLGSGKSIYTINIHDLNNPVVTDANKDNIDIWGMTSCKDFGDQFLYGFQDGTIGIFDFLETEDSKSKFVELGWDPASNKYRGVLDMTKKDEYILVTTNANDLSVIDTSKGAELEARHYNWANVQDSEKSMAIFGDYLFIANSEGVAVVNVANPNRPDFIEVTQQFGTMVKIKAINQRYAVMSNSAYLFLVDFANASNPQIIASTKTEQKVNDLAGDLTKIIAAESNDSAVKIFEVNQRPLSFDSMASGSKNQPLTGVLKIKDRENDPFTVRVLKNTANGKLVVNNDGSFSYQPNKDFNGDDNFTYEVKGLYGKTTSSQVKISISH